MPEWTNDISKHFIAGACAGSTTSLITCPLDVIKTRMQTLIPDNDNTTNSLKKKKLPYRGTLSSLQRIWKGEGIRGLYRGIGPTLLGYLPSNAIYFPTYHFCKKLYGFKSQMGDDHFIVHMFSAMTAGASGSIVTNPLWVIRTRLMTQHHINDKPVYKNAFNAAYSIFKREGFLAFYKGLGPSLLGTTHVLIQFPLYEKMKAWQMKRERIATINNNKINTININNNENRKNSKDDYKSKESNKEVITPLQVLIASTTSKFVASTVTYPHEVLRTRLQDQRTFTKMKYKNLRDAIRIIWKEEGINGFYRGLVTNICRVIPASAVTFLTYELMLQKLENSLDSTF